MIGRLLAFALAAFFMFVAIAAMLNLIYGIHVQGYVPLICAFIFTAVVFPSAFGKKKQEKKRPEDQSDRFNCPECGESIPVAAKSCRFCQTIISDKDRRATKAAPRRVKKRSDL